MAIIRYYLVDTSGPGALNNVFQPLHILHIQTHPNNNLGILYNNDMSEAVVKVSNDSPAALGIEHRRTYEQVEHGEVLDLLYTDSLWMDSTKTQPQRDAIASSINSINNTLNA